MAGFLDPSERVIDMVLTDQGKQLLMRGDLHFTFWQAFDDEVDYQPQATHLRADQTLAQRQQELTETPLVREATLGYRGLNFAADDTTNVHRPMYSGPPGVGQTSPLPQLLLDRPIGSLVGGEFMLPDDNQLAEELAARLGGDLTSDVYRPLSVSVDQQKLSRVYVQRDSTGKEVLAQVGPIDAGYQRTAPVRESVAASYTSGSFPPEYRPEGFLLTVLVSGVLRTDELGQVEGGYEEVVHNRDSDGRLSYRNDLSLELDDA